ncbi:hypothetical protein LCGC14_2373080, partial [marine sediment metagenome]
MPFSEKTVDHKDFGKISIVKSTRSGRISISMKPFEPIRLTIPVFVFYKMYNLAPPSNTETACLIGITFLLSYISWTFIEGPFRNRKLLTNQKSILITGCSTIFIFSSIGAVMALEDGFPSRASNETNKLLAAATDSATIKQYECAPINSTSKAPPEICQTGSLLQEAPTFAVWGDSHGDALLPAINKAAQANNIRGVSMVKGGCIPLLDAHQIEQGYETCDDIGRSLITYLSEHTEINKVILISRWAIYAEGVRYRNENGNNVYIKDSETVNPSLDENKKVFIRSMKRTLDELAKLNLQIILVTATPETEWN